MEAGVGLVWPMLALLEAAFVYLVALTGEDKRPALALLEVMPYPPLTALATLSRRPHREAPKVAPRACQRCAYRLRLAQRELPYLAVHWYSLACRRYARKATRRPVLFPDPLFPRVLKNWSVLPVLVQAQAMLVLALVLILLEPARVQVVLGLAQVWALLELAPVLLGLARAQAVQ